MSRMEIQALTTLIETAEGGGHTLPTELLDAYRIHQRARALTVAAPLELDVDTAAARIVSAVAAGEEPDPLELGRNLDAADRDRQAANRAQLAVAAAIEQAANAAVLLAADLTERIITKHLRPAHDGVLDEARKSAADLAGYGLDPYTLITAPARARNAYAKLTDLATRRTVIRNAARKANALGHRTPQHDQAGFFSTFPKPMTFHPNCKPPTQIPALPFPEDPRELLLWLVGPEATAAQPWLPTVAEQDSAWWEQVGEQQQDRANAAQFARGFLPA